MSIDDRLRNHLRVRAGDIEPDRTDVADVTARARRRRRVRVVAGVGTAVVVAATVVGVGLLVRDPADEPPVTLAAQGDDTTQAPAGEESTTAPAEDGTPADETPVDRAGDQPAGAGRAALDFEQVTAPADGILGPIAVGRDGEFLLLQQRPPALHVSVDGRSWSTIELDIEPDRVASTVVWSGDRYYVAGTGFGSRSEAGEVLPGAGFVAVSDDLTTWAVSDLTPPTAPPWPGTSWGGVVEQIVAGPAGVLVIGSQWIDLDLPVLLGDPSLAARGWSIYGDGDEIGFEVFGPSGEGERETQRFTAAELGIDPALADLLARGSNAILWLSTAGGPFELVDEVVGLDATWVNGAVATDAGFVLAGTVGSPQLEPGTAALWVSADGRSWDRIDGPGVGDSDVVGGLAELDGRLTLVGTCEGRPVSWTQADGGSWQMLDLSDAAGVAAGESSAMWLAAGGPAGHVALVETYPRWQPPVSEVAVEAEGFSWLHDLALEASTVLAPDGSVVAVLEGTGMPGESDLPERLRATDNGGLEVLDESLAEVVAVFTAEQVGSAFDQAFEEAIGEEALGEEAFGEAGENTVELGGPRQALLHSRDGVSWSASPLDDLVDSTSLFIPTALAVGGDTVLLLGFEEREPDPPRSREERPDGQDDQDTSSADPGAVAYVAELP